MTSAQLSPSGNDLRSVSRIACVAAAGLAVLLAAGCQQKLQQPTTLINPDPGDQLWAVAPFANESGVSTVNAHRVADLFTQQLEQVDGINTVPVNRVVAAMRHGGIARVAAPEDAVQLIQLLDVDALVVGTVTAWEPYPPPTLGMAVLLFSGNPNRVEWIDPQELVRSSSGNDAPGMVGSPTRILAQAAGVFDARNHETLGWIEVYASGRTEPGEPFGTDVYLMDMELYTQFVSFRLIHDLLGYGRGGETPVADAESR
jgi:hypothetical protein